MVSTKKNGRSACKWREKAVVLSITLNAVSTCKFLLQVKDGSGAFVRGMEFANVFCCRPG